MITIATSIGRGTDIVLGGNIEKQIQPAIQTSRSRRSEELAGRQSQLKDDSGGPARRRSAQGGLRIIATERHESRRIDNQLRTWPRWPPGRPWFVALLPVAGRSADAHLRGRPRQRDHGPPEDAGWRAIEARHRHPQHRKRPAQGRGTQLDIRKQLLEYDDVSNDQRKVIYQQRNDPRMPTNLAEQIAAMREGVP